MKSCGASAAHAVCPPDKEDLRGFEWYYWHHRTHLELLTLRHADAVFGVGFSPDGKRLASTGRDGTLKVWDSRNVIECTVTFARGGQTAGNDPTGHGRLPLPGSILAKESLP